MLIRFILSQYCQYCIMYNNISGAIFFPLADIDYTYLSYCTQTLILLSAILLNYFSFLFSYIISSLYFITNGPSEWLLRFCCIVDYAMTIKALNLEDLKEYCICVNLFELQFPGVMHFSISLITVLEYKTIYFICLLTGIISCEEGILWIGKQLWTEARATHTLENKSDYGYGTSTSLHWG